MFRITTQSSYGNVFEAKIRGCPSSGIGAVDFRRANNLPDGTDNEIALPVCEFVNEGAARKLPLDKEANFRLFDEVYRYRSAWVTLDVQPATLKAFLDSPSADGIVALYADMKERFDEGERISAAKAEERRLAEEAWQREVEERAAAMAKARELLAGELEIKAEAIRDRDTLSEFLSAVPDDALRGAAKLLASERAGTTAEKIMEEVEAASPGHTIFGDNDEE